MEGGGLGDDENESLTDGPKNIIDAVFELLASLIILATVTAHTDLVLL